jgi:membrane-associated phospholipid phosphatase
MVVTGTSPARAREFTPRRLGLLPIDWLVAAYFAITLILLVIFGDRVAWELPVSVRLFFFGIMLFLRRTTTPRHRLWWLLRVSYPIAFYPYFYGEIRILNQLITPLRFDDVVVGWEEAVFHSMPSVDLRTWLPWKPLSEYLHMAYLSYYALAPFALITLLLKEKFAAVAETVFTVTMTFMTCYFLFIFFPVLGPFHYLDTPDPAGLGYVFPRLTRFVLDHGSSRGSAFPSSHVAVAVAVLLQAWRHDRFVSTVLFFIVPALAVGAVYGGYHYAIDAVAGLIVALLISRVGPGLCRKLTERRAPSHARTRRRRT